MKIRLYIAGIGVIALALTACSSGDTTAGSTGAAKETVSFAFSSAVPQIEKVPTLQALAVLAGEGYPTKTTWLQSSEDPVQAVARGDALFGSASTTSVMAAIAKGVPVTAVMSALNPAYAIVARSDIGSPKDMNGKRLAINSAVSSTTLYATLMTQDLPNVKPQLLIIPGTPARISALIANQADAAVVQLSALPTLEAQAPGKFHVIFNVAKQAQGLSDSVIFVQTSTLKSKPDLVKRVVQEIVKAQAAVYTKVDGLASAIAKDVPKMDDPKLAASMAKVYTDSVAWPADGGFTEKDMTVTLDRLSSAGLVKPAPSLNTCCDLTVVP